MKKDLILLFVAMLVTISCNQSGEKIQDIRLNDHLTRSELVLLPLNEQRLIIAQLTPEKQYVLWKAKMEYLINNSEFDVNEKEILHTLYEQMSVDYFEGNDTSLTNILDISIKALRNQHHWTEDELFINLMTIMTEDEFESNALIHHYKE